MNHGSPLRIKVRQQECNGCLSCMTVCSTVNEAYASLSGARVQVELSPFEGAPKITICRQCAKAACIEECPTGAIARDDDGYILVDYARCTATTDGCRGCIDACPFHAMFWNALTERVMKCELCHGDPQCVKTCAAGALTMQMFRPTQKQGEENGKG